MTNTMHSILNLLKETIITNVLSAESGDERFGRSVTMQSISNMLKETIISIVIAAEMRGLSGQ